MSSVGHHLRSSGHGSTNAAVETLNINGAPSLSLPFPPFMEKAPPPPPPPSPIRSMPMAVYHKSVKLAQDHPYMVGGMALAMTAGLGYGGYNAYKTYITHGSLRRTKGRKLGSKGLVQDGMLKEAIGTLYHQASRDLELKNSHSGPISVSTPAGPACSHSAQGRVHCHCGRPAGQRGRRARTTA